MNHQFQLRFRAGQIPLQNIGEVPRDVAQIGVPREKTPIAAKQLLRPAGTRSELLVPHLRLLGDLLVTNRKV